MDFDNELDSDKGLELETFAPIINTNDIYGEKINSMEILKDYEGFLIDFFRGAF